MVVNVCTLVCAWPFVDTLLKPESEICGLTIRKNLCSGRVSGFELYIVYNF